MLTIICCNHKINRNRPKRYSYRPLPHAPIVVLHLSTGEKCTLTNFDYTDHRKSVAGLSTGHWYTYTYETVPVTTHDLGLTPIVWNRVKLILFNLQSGTARNNNIHRQYSKMMLAGVYNIQATDNNNKPHNSIIIFVTRGLQITFEL